MHQIQRLEIVGFKSFCDRTDIHFNQGITAVVGPNGCGKSNIADAISWVVGEQSAKSLRTDRMEGVIFNGTQARKATSLAEVVLTLRLSEQATVPEHLELNPECFTVGRRLYRSGESEYYLDGRRCRLRDIQTLFEGTGLGPNSYALIEQGRIGQILSSKPADRRSLIEEAARITLFKSRRTSAEVKLELARQNLLRVSDIVREIVRQLNALKRQAAKARRYARLREDLREVQRLKIGLESRELSQRLVDCGRRFEEAQGREQDLVLELARADSERARLQDTCRLQEAQVAERMEQLSRLQLEIERTHGLRARQETQRDDLAARLADLEQNKGAVQQRAELAASEQSRLEKTLDDLTAEIRLEEETLHAQQARGDLVTEAIRETEAGIDGIRTFLLNGAGRLSDLKNQEIRCNENLERIELRSVRLREEAEARLRERGGVQLELEALLERTAANGRREQELNETLRADEASGSALEARLEQLIQELTALQEESSLMHHRFSSLEEIERRRSNYSEGVQKFLSTQLPGEEAVPGQTLADHVETDSVYEAAVEDYLNDPLQYILVDGIHDAVRNVDRLRRIGAGRCTFMTLKNGGSNGTAAQRRRIEGEGVVGYLDQILRMKEDVRHAFERALPEFAGTVVVTDLDTAFRLTETHPGSSFLTLGGESYSPRGTLTAVGERKSMAGFLTLKREKRELEETLRRLRGTILSTRAEADRIKAERDTIRERVKDSTAELRRLEVEGIGMHHERTRLENEAGRLEQMARVAGLELSQLQAEKSDYLVRQQEALMGIQEIEGKSRSGEGELKDLTARLDSLRSESSDLARTLGKLQSAHAVRGEKHAGLLSDLRRLQGETEELRKRLEINRLETAETRQKVRDLEQAGRETLARLEETGRAVERTQEDLAGLKDKLAASRQGLEELERRLRELHAVKEAAMELRSKIEIEKTRLENDLEHLERSCLEEFHLAPAEVASQIAEDQWLRDAAEVRLACEALRERVENFGAINMRALEEYRELDERHQFLVSQRADIEQSIADTEKAIAEINRRSLEQFQDAFHHIRENFKEAFQILFKGGQCDLRLLDEADALESGIDIIAQPPGKRLQNVLLLSGGEKALTALALLIAIFRYRPSPFCVLDEVDAPLDDANVTRFSDLITELSKETQFVLITHNKKTMEIAQTLYGVTMEEPGVSKIVSVQLQHRPVALAS